jgi:hypothetical protein
VVGDPFGASPAELRAVADQLTEVSSRMKKVWQRLLQGTTAQGNIDNPGEPSWGNGEDGHQFADGPNGYVAQRDSFGVAMQAKTDLLDRYAEVLRQTADGSQAQDDS